MSLVSRQVVPAVRAQRQVQPIIRGGADLAPPVITAETFPFLGPITDGDQVQDTYTAGTGYASTANGGAATIVSTDTVVTINGIVGALTDVVNFEDVVSVTDTVTDSEGNERAFFAGTQTVAGIAPTATAAPIISGAKVGETPSITPGTYDGVPTPTVVGAFTLGGVAFDPPTELQPADAGKTLAYVEQASNGIAPDAGQSVSETVQVEFTPADLFTGTDKGAFYRIHPDALYTDTSGTVNAAVGEEVAYVADLSGNGNHRIQSNFPSRPRLQQDVNGNYYLDYDGVDDVTSVVFPSLLNTPITTVSAFRNEPENGNSRILMSVGGEDDKRLLVTLLSSGHFSLYAQASTGESTQNRTPPMPSDDFIGIVSVVWQQSNSTYRVQGVQNTSLFDPGRNDQTNGFRVGADEKEPPGNYTVTKEYGNFMIDRRLTTSEIEQAEAYFANETGTALS